MLICCMPVFCGCNDEDENHSIPQLEIAEEFLIQDFDNKKHDIEIPVITNLSKDEWRITSSAPNWCMATKVCSLLLRARVSGIVVSFNQSQTSGILTL